MLASSSVGSRPIRNLYHAAYTVCTPQPFHRKFYRSEIFPIGRIVRTYAFADINQAFADAARGTVIKAVLMMGY